jgi:hypothetical protein
MEYEAEKRRFLGICAFLNMFSDFFMIWLSTLSSVAESLPRIHVFIFFSISFSSYIGSIFGKEVQFTNISTSALRS